MKTKEAVMLLVALGVLVYFVFPGALVGQTVTAKYLGKNNAPIAGAICYMDDQNSKTTSSTGSVSFPVLREGRYEVGCYCPGTNRVTKGNTYGTSITLTDLLCTTSGGGSTPTTQPGSKCQDTDGGKYQNTFGRLIYDGIPPGEPDTCKDSTHVDEYYCNGDTPAHTILACASGYECASGRCAASDTPTTCTDSDGGQTIASKGVVTQSDIDGSTTYTDGCYSDGSVHEYYCSGTIAKETRLSCASGKTCDDGICVTGSVDDGGNDDDSDPPAPDYMLYLLAAGAAVVGLMLWRKMR